MTISATDSKGLQGKAFLELDKKELENAYWKFVKKVSGGEEDQGSESAPTKAPTETDTTSTTGTKDD